MDLSTLTYKQIRAVVLIANDDADATLKATVLGIWNAFAGVA